MDWEREFKGYETEVEPNKRDRAYSWMTAIGLQDVDALKSSVGLVHQGPRKGGRWSWR